ncbi:hypothetical protein BDR26DRAFT_1013579 [Obelidium mucronatum]|nr:hypothetical protein BDR26DRAFT_1013579 [Obelidium mucronatum]
MACGNRLLTKPWMTRRPWSDLRELCPDLHQRVMETKGAPKELVEEATEALDKIYINSNNTLKLVFFDKTKCTVQIPGLKIKYLTNQDLTALEDLCFSGIVDIDGNCSENDEERIAALAKYIYEKFSNNKYHVVFAPTPADTNATKIAKKATACAARQQAANEKLHPSKLVSSSGSTIPAHASPSSAKLILLLPLLVLLRLLLLLARLLPPKTLTTSAAKATTDPTIPNTATNTTPAIWFPKECHF